MRLHWRKNNMFQYKFWIAFLALTVQLCFPFIQSHHLNHNHHKPNSLSTGFDSLCCDHLPSNLDHDQSSCLVCLTVSQYSQLILKTGYEWISKPPIYLSQPQHLYRNPLYSLSPGLLIPIRGPPVLHS